MYLLLVLLPDASGLLLGVPSHWPLSWLAALSVPDACWAIDGTRGFYHPSCWAASPTAGPACSACHGAALGSSSSPQGAALLLLTGAYKVEVWSGASKA